MAFSIKPRHLLYGAIGLGALALFRRAQTQYDFKGKVALVTGGSRGLGLVLARQLAERGANVAVCARDEQELTQAKASFARYGLNVYTVQCDITDHAQVREMVDEVQREVGPVDVLVNNAGVMEVGPVETMEVADYETSLDTHFWGPLYTTLTVLPGMQQRGGGRIVNISSIGGKIGVPHMVPYCAGKFALVGFSRALGAEVRKDGIYVTTVCPGLMRTGSPRNVDFKGKHRAEYAWFAISDSLPLISVDVHRAAWEIVEACSRGDSESVFPLPAKLAITVDSLFPEFSLTMAGIANRMLPGPGGIGKDTRKGFESESFVTNSFLAATSREAAARNNEVLPKGPREA